MLKMITGVGVWLFLMLIAVQALSQKIKITDDIFLIPLHDSIYIHETWDSLPGYGRFSSNGMIIISRGKALMIDTPMDNQATAVLAAYLKDNWSVEVERLIIGHFHDDCLGGLPYLQSVGVESVASNLTINQCRKLELPIPSIGFEDALDFTFYEVKIECRFFGAGHSFDNITVWLPKEKILFGGCLVKSMDSKGLGNLSDAVVNEWDETILRLKQNYPDGKVVVPGHGNFGGIELLDHTLTLVNKYNSITPN